VLENASYEIYNQHSSKKMKINEKHKANPVTCPGGP
jgi:hypothetical protein